MKILLITLMMISTSLSFASCISSSEPCNDVILTEDVVIEDTPTEDAESFQPSDESDPEERAWLEENWE